MNTANLNHTPVDTRKDIARKFEQACKFVWGDEEFIKKGCEFFGVKRRSFQRWLVGKFNIPSRVLLETVDLVKEKAGE